MREEDQNMHDQWSHNRRSRLEPVIRERFKARGQTDDEATAYIEDACWERPVVAIARVRRTIALVARST